MPSRTKKFRGLRTHGRGKKAGRGAGIIGGHGNAGLGKHERLHMLKFDPDHFGRRGFKRPQCVVSANRIINIKEMLEQLERYVELGFAKKEGSGFAVDLTGAGIDKLLGKGDINIAVIVTVSQISAQARDKIVASGGSVAE
ncbi:MAG: 50S ribosomal protein L15 [Methanomassiliicoccaceae archaeon]|jgi:large subunit ribosomal protein L15|nr:50S ribosomal protein L15 [Methanomassiliicoccaceae archaeon]